MALSHRIMQPALPAQTSFEAAQDFIKPPIKLPLPVIFYLIAIYIPMEFQIGGIFMSGVRLLLIIFIIPLTIKLLMGRFGQLIWTDFIFFLFCPWVIYTLHLNSPESAFSFGGSVSVEFFGGYMLSRAYIRTPEAFVGLCKALFLLLIFTLPFAVFESQTGRALIPETLNKLPFFFSFKDFHHPTDSVRMGLERSQVIFAHPIHYGLFCSTLVSLAFVGFKGIYSNLFRYFISFCIIFGVFLSLSSGAILPVVLHFLFIFWAYAFNKVHTRWIIFITLVFVAYGVVDMISNRPAIQVFLSYATFSPHNAYWRILIFEWGMKNVLMHPLVGIGMNDWVRLWFMHTDSVDNFWLLTTMRYGIPAFVLVATGFILPLWKIALRKIDESSVTWQFRRAWMFTMIGLMLTLCTVDVWATMLSYVAFIFGAGIWLITTDLTTNAGTKASESSRFSNVVRKAHVYAPSRSLSVTNPPTQVVEATDPTPLGTHAVLQHFNYTRFRQRPKQVLISKMQKPTRKDSGHK